MFENVIRSFCIDHLSFLGEQESQWNLQKGSTLVWVDIHTFEDGISGDIQVMFAHLQIVRGSKIKYLYESTRGKS